MASITDSSAVGNPSANDGSQTSSTGADKKQRRQLPNWVKTVLDYAVYLIIRVFFCVIQAIPLSWCDGLARGLAYLLNDVLKFRRKVIVENLTSVFPSYTESQVKDISRQMWHHLVLMACEVAHAPRMVHETNWRQYFSIQDRRAIVGALMDQRPVVMVAGHFGNFELGGFISGLLGVPTYTVARRLDNPFLHRFVNDFRQRSGQFILPKDGSSDLVELALSRGHTMTLLGDQYAGDKGCWVDFLGRPASCHKALALFTLTSGAPMMVVATRRLNGPLHFSIDFGGLADPDKLSRDQQSVKGLTEWYNDRMASQILETPGQYWWVHRRWKPKQKKQRGNTETTRPMNSHSQSSESEKSLELDCKPVLDCKVA